MAYGRRKKGGQALMELAKKRRQKVAKDKAGKLKPTVIEPTLSRLRTGAVPKRKKGGQRLVDIAEKGRKARESRVGGKRYVTPTRRKPAAPTPTRKPAAAKKPRAGVAPRTTRTPAQRDTDRARLKNIQSEARSMSNLATGQAGDLSKAERATWEAIVGLATAPLAALKGVHGAYKAKKAADLARAAAKAKRAAAAAKKAAEAKKGVSGIGQTRAASARARTSGLGKAKPKPKPKAKKKKSAAQTKRESMRGASAWR